VAMSKVYHLYRGGVPAKKSEEEKNSMEVKEVKKEEAQAEYPESREELIELLKKKEAEAKEYKELMLRYAAEVENLKKSFKREKEEYFKYALETFMKELLPFVDNLERALEAAAALGVFVMIHVGGTRSSMEKLVNMLRPGDVVTHSYHGNDHGILDDAGRVKEGIREAQRKGVIFDVGHGAASFWFRNGVPALLQGFPPDSISTDLHMGNINGHVHSMLDTMSKYLAMGMPFQEVIYRSTTTPAKATSARSCAA